MALGSSLSHSSGSKRARSDLGDNSMGSDAHVHIDLNDEEDSFPIDEEVEEVDPLHNRPLHGRDKAKRAQRFAANMDAKAKHRETLQKGVEAHVASLEDKKARKARLQAEQDDLIKQQKLINHLTIMEKGGIEEEDVEIFKEAKAPSRSWVRKLFKM